jgi:hypothetical protein
MGCRWIGTLVELVGWIDIIGTLLGATTVVQVSVRISLHDFHISAGFSNRA